MWTWHFCYIIIRVVTGVNASWHVCLSCQLLELLFDNSNCEGIIMFKVHIYSLRILLLHLHAFQLRLCTSILDSKLVLNLHEMSNHNKRNGKWQPSWVSCIACLIYVCVYMHACMQMHMCVCVWGTPTHPWSHLPTPTQERPHISKKVNKSYYYQDKSILFEDLQSVEILSPMGGCIVSCVGGLVDRWDDGWGLFNHYLDKIEIIQFSLV